MAADREGGRWHRCARGAVLLVPAAALLALATFYLPQPGPSPAGACTCFYGEEHEVAELELLSVKKNGVPVTDTTAYEERRLSLTALADGPPPVIRPFLGPVTGEITNDNSSFVADLVREEATQ